MTETGAPDPTDPRLGADAAAVARLDELSTAAATAQPGDPAIWGPLWQATFDLRQWLFIARGEHTNPTPYIGVLEQGPMLFAFSTPERAQAGAAALGIPEGERDLILAVPTPGAIEWAASFAQHGVFGISFDHPLTGYFCPLANLLGIRDWLARER